MMRCFQGSAYCGIKSTWLRFSRRISSTNSLKLVACVRLTLAFGSRPCRSPPEISNLFHRAASRFTSRFSSQLRRPFSSTAWIEAAVLGEKLLHSLLVQIVADLVQVPQRVIEDDEYVGKLVQRGKHFRQPRVAGIGGERLKFAASTRRPTRWAGCGCQDGRPGPCPKGVVHSTETGMWRALATVRSSMGAWISSWSVIETSGCTWSDSAICRLSRSKAKRGVSGGVQ